MRRQSNKSAQVQTNDAIASGRRAAIGGALLLLGAPSWAIAPAPDAIVGDAPRHMRGRKFATIGEALAAAPDTQARYTVWIGAGKHRGPFHVGRANVTLLGRGRGQTRLTRAAGAGEMAPDGKPFGTFRTACVDVQAPGIRLDGLTIENTYDAPAEMRRPGGLRADDGGSQQAIALSLGRNSDRAIVTNCEIASHQDTLYAAEGRALFHRCRISGSYDFIFGGAAARFEACELRSRVRLDPVEGYIAAPSTMIDRPAGLVFDRCVLTAEPGVPDGSVFLGRPWRLSTTVDGRRVGDLHSVGMAAYLYCTLGRHVAPTGWTRMWYTGRDGNPRTWFEPEEARFFEFHNVGPGAAGSRRGRMLTQNATAALSRSGMFGSWNATI